MLQGGRKTNNDTLGGLVQQLIKILKYIYAKLQKIYENHIFFHASVYEDFPAGIVVLTLRRLRVSDQ